MPNKASQENWYVNKATRNANDYEIAIGGVGLDTVLTVSTEDAVEETQLEKDRALLAAAAPKMYRKLQEIYDMMAVPPDVGDRARLREEIEGLLNTLTAD